MADRTAYIGVGANINPESNILSAIERLRDYTRITGVSAFFQTPALKRPDQPPYLNGVIRAQTNLEARSLKFDVLRRIESELGRVRSGDPYAARTIDLDLLLFDDWVLAEKDLCLPDPDIRARPFLAAGLHELDPDLELPGSRERVADLPCLARAEKLVRAGAFTKEVRQALGL